VGVAAVLREAAICPGAPLSIPSPEGSALQGAFASSLSRRSVSFDSQATGLLLGAIQTRAADAAELSEFGGRILERREDGFAFGDLERQDLDVPLGRYILEEVQSPRCGDFPSV
jgi:hypothetical protein